MRKKLSDIFRRLPLIKSFVTESELVLFSTCIVATAFAFVLHVGLLITYIVIAVPEFIIINVASITVYLILGFLIKQRRYALAGHILSYEVCAYTVFSMYLSGPIGHVYLYFVIIIMFQMVVNYSRMRVRVINMAIVWSLMIVSLVLFNNTPPIPKLAKYDSVYAFFNMNIVTFAIILEISVGNITKMLVDRVKELRIHELESQVYKDPLTNLYNRRYTDIFFKDLQQLNKNGCYVALMDIDDFKLINDRFGHDVGDKVLRSVADELRRSLRKTDTIFRWGGEEFLIFIDIEDVNIAYELLDRLRRIIEGKKHVDIGSGIFATVTIGVSRLKPDDIGGSLIRCDKMMYRGKTSGKNSVMM